MESRGVEETLGVGMKSHKVGVTRTEEERRTESDYLERDETLGEKIRRQVSAPRGVPFPVTEGWKNSASNPRATRISRTNATWYSLVSVLPSRGSYGNYPRAKHAGKRCDRPSTMGKFHPGGTIHGDFPTSVSPALSNRDRVAVG